MVSKRATVRVLLDRHPESHAEELGIDPTDGPSDLFRLLCAAILFSAPISGDLAMAAARALTDHGWTTAEELADSTWQERAKVLNEAGYGRYDERTARMLADTAEHLLDRYGGDLRRLREAAERDPGKERRLLKECKGLGDVGVDILFREVQAGWDELHPFADKRALAAARKLDLGDDAEALAELASKRDLPRLVSALVRVELEGAHDDIRAAADG